MPNQREIVGELRAEYHALLARDLLRWKRSNKDGSLVANVADTHSKASVAIAAGVYKRLGASQNTLKISEQSVGGVFTKHTLWFVKSVFERLEHLRPGKWVFVEGGSISKYEQYRHLADLADLVKGNPGLQTAVGGDYFIVPDIVIAREPESDEAINKKAALVGKRMKAAALTPLRTANTAQNSSILHASISCKWSIRSDRSQNTRTEALNLIRNRKGGVPHIAAVTFEPTPQRVASWALGTGDLDCTYHAALFELLEAAREADLTESLAFFQMLIDGRRLRDISDLPFDLAI